MASAATHGTHASWVIANNAFRTDVRVVPATVVARVGAAFRALGRRPVLTTFEPFDIDVEGALAVTSWKKPIELPVMVRQTRLPQSPVPSGADLHWLDEGSPADLDGLRDILRRGFADDDEEREIIDSLMSRAEAIGAPDVAGVVATLKGQPAACALVYRVGDEAVVGWVATVPEARGRGLGGLVTTAVTNRGFAFGASFVTLQASRTGLPVYVRIGYETIMMSRIWVGPEVAAEVG